MSEIKLNELPLHKVYLAFAVFFGLIWLFMLPPFQGPDEPVHFNRAYMLSQGDVLPVLNSEGNSAGAYLPASIKELKDTLEAGMRKRYSELKTGKVKQDRVKQDLDALIQAGKIELKPEERLFVSNIAGTYPPLAYAPQVAGIAAARLLSLPVLHVFYFARMAGFVFFVMAMYFLIKHLQVLKLSLFTIALMPMSLQQGFVVGTDCVTIVMLLVFVCYVVNIIFSDSERLLENKDIVLMYMMCITLAIIKGPYIIIALLLYFVPKDKYKSRFLYWTCGGGVIMAGLIAVLTWKYLIIGSLNSSVIPIANATIGTGDPKDMDPVHIIYRVYYTMFSIPLAKSAFWLGWEDVRLPFVFLASYTCLMIWPMLIMDKGLDERRRQLRRTGYMMMLFIFCVWTAYHISMYLAEPQKPAGKILGMQGRYFIRILFPFLVGLYIVIPDSWKQLFKRLPYSESQLVRGHVALIGILLSVATVYIWMTYYY